MKTILALMAMLTATGVSREKELGGKWSWEGRHERLIAEIKERQIETYDIVFLGDALTELMKSENLGNKAVFEEYYGGMKTLNLGIQGDRAENLLWRLENGELDGYQAKLFRIHIGTCNLPRRGKLERVAESVKAIIELVKAKHPEAKIELVAVLPRYDSRFHNRFSRIKALNALLMELADGERTVWTDAWNEFMDENGKPKSELYSGMLYLKPQGYRTLFEFERSRQAEMLR